MWATEFICKFGPWEFIPVGKYLCWVPSEPENNHVAECYVTKETILWFSHRCEYDLKARVSLGSQQKIK
jgi:hypothetical protein